jgi:hypothetical protein
MSSKEDIRSTAPAAGPSSIPHLGKSSRPSAVPPRSGIGSASKVTSQKGFEDSSRPPPSYLAQGSNFPLDDIDEEPQQKTAIKHSQLPVGASKLPEPSKFRSSLYPTRIPAPSAMPSHLDTTRIPAPSAMPSHMDTTRLPAASRMPSKLDTTRILAPSVMQSKMYASRIPATSTVKEPPAYVPNIASLAPPSTKSILVTPKDIHMASRQPNFATLTPKEQTEQNDWAQDMIKRVGACPENFEWVRRENPGGYQCEGGGHGMTDELLAEGKGGIMAHATKKWGENKGPYYPGPESGKFKRV